MKISYLADHPEFIETLAPWIYTHWRPLLKEEALTMRIAKLQIHLNKDTLPIALVAHEGKQVYGIAAIRFAKIFDRNHCSKHKLKFN